MITNLARLLLIFALATTVRGWWQLEGVAPSGLSGLECSRIPGLTGRQREMCIQHGQPMAALVHGVEEAFSECERTFTGEIFNCTAAARQSTGTPNKVASRESAYIYALAAASASHAIAKACGKGALEECGCGALPQGTSRDFLWSGCSDNVKYGNTFGRKFMDQEARRNGDPRFLMDVHNNRVGRRLLASSMDRTCKCHGVSGSCVTKTCWKVVPKMSTFAERLKKKMDHALQVKAAGGVAEGVQLRAVVPTSGGRSGRYLREEEDVGRVAKSALIFLESSPDFCERPWEVAGRECGNHCGEICCGRGWKTVRRIVEEPCRCAFVWCCEVKCSTCMVMKSNNYCK